MADPTRKTTGAVVHVRVQTDSALERLLEAKSAQGVTKSAAIHQMAELFEKALAENWMPPLTQGHDAELRELLKDEAAHQAERLRMTAEAPNEYLRDLPFVESPEGSVHFRRFMIGHDERSAQEVTEEMALALAREQFPAGLVPVIDEGDEDEMTEAEALEYADVEDLLDPTGAEREAHDVQVLREQREVGLTDEAEEDLAHLA